MAGIPLQFPLVTGWPDVQANMEAIAVDGLAASAFLADRTAALADLGIARGTGSVTWPGSTTYSNYVDVAHGLSTAPTFAGAFMLGDGFWFTTHSIGASSFAVQANSASYQPPVGTVSDFVWLAIL